MTRNVNGVFGPCHIQYEDLDVQSSAVWVPDSSTLTISADLTGACRLRVFVKDINVMLKLPRGEIPPQGVTIEGAIASTMLADASGTSGGIDDSQQQIQSEQQYSFNMPISVDGDVAEAMDDSDSHSVAADAHSLPATTVAGDPQPSGDAALEDLRLSETMLSWFTPPVHPTDEHTKVFYRASVSLAQNLVYCLGMGERYGVHEPHPALSGVAPLATCTYHPVQAYFKSLFGDCRGLCYKCLSSASDYSHAQRAAMSIRHCLSLCTKCDHCGRAVDVRTFPRLSHDKWKVYVTDRARSNTLSLPIVGRLYELFHLLYRRANHSLAPGTLPITVAELFSFSLEFPKSLLVDHVFTDKEFCKVGKKPSGPIKGVGSLGRPRGPKSTDGVGYQLAGPANDMLLVPASVGSKSSIGRSGSHAPGDADQGVGDSEQISSASLCAVHSVHGDDNADVHNESDYEDLSGFVLSVFGDQGAQATHDTIPAPTQISLGDLDDLDLSDLEPFSEPPLNQRLPPTTATAPESSAQSDSSISDLSFDTFQADDIFTNYSDYPVQGQGCLLTLNEVPSWLGLFETSVPKGADLGGDGAAEGNCVGDIGSGNSSDGSCSQSSRVDVHWQNSDVTSGEGDDDHDLTPPFAVPEPQIFYSPDTVAALESIQLWGAEAVLSCSKAVVSFSPRNHACPGVKIRSMSPEFASTFGVALPALSSAGLPAVSLSTLCGRATSREFMFSTKQAMFSSLQVCARLYVNLYCAGGEVLPCHVTVRALRYPTQLCQGDDDRWAVLTVRSATDVGHAQFTGDGLF